MRFVIVTVLISLLALPAGAASISNVEKRDTPLSSRVLNLDPEPKAMNLEVAFPLAAPAFVSLASKASTTLNCENDNMINGASTLVLSPGDFVGNVFELNEGSPQLVHTVRFGLLDLGQTYPATLGFDIFQDNQMGQFEFVAGFDVTINGIAQEGETVDIDLSGFDVQVQHDLLTLFGDLNGANNSIMLPAGDNSPRCLNEAGNNVCSVHLPSGSSDLFIYGVVDADACPRTGSNILNFDLVHEVVLEEIVATRSVSWGTMKAPYSPDADKVSGESNQ